MPGAPQSRHIAATSITLARSVGVRDGPARLCELFEAVAVFFAAGRGWGGYDFPIQPRRN
jgi:hypothetical protein